MFAIVRSFLLALAQLLVLDALFIGLCLLAIIVPLGMYKRAGYAVMKRNFIGYFSNPTGYVFLCVFVLLASFSAFWPNEFFNANLANLDQLNRFFPLVMLVFIPAITMSIWAEERRQGTDELLLTLPAGDFDIVMGKFLAAASIYTCSLIFAQLSTYIVLISLTYGELDIGLLCSTYLGYWLIGLAMLAIGMVASFLTSNLTVGFILGALFNAPLVFAMWADSRQLSDWSLASQFGDLGRGVISLSSVTYFVMVAVAGVYLSIVLIGRRHWAGGRDGHSLGGHYLVRILAVVVFAASLNILFSNRLLVRGDVTENKTSSLSPSTKQLLNTLKPEHTIHIDAFVGAQIPQEYVKTRFELISMLKEFESRSSGKIKVTIQDNLELFSQKAVQAERRYGIKPQQVVTRARGKVKEEPVILGAAITCGLEKVVIPFFDYGIPVEYELIRSVSTVAKSQRKKLGVVRTDAQFMGGMDFSGGGFRNLPREQIIDELEKQYEVEAVEPNGPIDTSKYDVLLVVQPSSLTQQELDNVTQAVKQGIPTAIFEDPLPAMMPQAPGTGDPKRQSPMMSMMGGGQPPPKGNIRMLWEVLGIKVEGEDRGPGNFQSVVVWQRFNPYPKLASQRFGDEWVFVSPDAPDTSEPFNPTDPVTAGLEEVLFPFPGAIEANPDRSSDLTFTPIATTGKRSGTISPSDYRANAEDPVALQVKRGKPASAKYTIAARIHGKADAKKSSDGDSKDKSSDDKKDGDKKDGDDKSKDAKAKPINVIYVADIDLLSSPFVRIRAQPDQEVRFRFENVTFVLNVIDALAGEDAFLDIRKRKTKYSTLRVIERQIDEARSNETQEREKFDEEYNEAITKAKKESQDAVKKFRDAVNELNDKARKGETIDFSQLKAMQDQLNIQQTYAEQRRVTQDERLKSERDEKIQDIRRRMDLKILTIQRWIKMLAVVIPPIPPLLIGLIVWVVRQLREREGISKTRMK